MDTISVSCNKCGAPLEVPDKTRFLTCSHCGSRLEVQRSGGAYFTSVLEEISRNTEKMSSDLEVIRLQNDLERIDREWQMKRQGLMTHNKNGGESEPSIGGAVVGGGIAIVFGVIWMIGAFSMEAPFVFPLFGFVFISIAFWNIVSSVNKSNEYESLKRQYESQRSAFLEKMEKT
jgi:hypothetical protein